ncbi:MAG TPA: tetratricopeptide repeat protein [Bryobacteraceae bacterium]|nr:tetratricopeptide repeat protein [Bryobacteraceae bacterium]
MIRRLLAALAASVVVFSSVQAQAPTQPAAASGPFETTSRLGRKLYGLPDSDGAIQTAKQKFAADPKNVSLCLKLSQAQAAKRQYWEAVATCTECLKDAPRNADLYLERGHRELGLRDFQRGMTDLSRAVEINPKSLDAHYHLGMAQYFLREFGPAAQQFQRALDLAKTSDNIIDCSNWLYVSLHRDGQTEAAERVLTRITPRMRNHAPHLYFYLRLLRFYQGVISEKQTLLGKPSNPNDVESELAFDTITYGVGNWHIYTDTDPAKGLDLFRRVVAGNAWNAWGFIGSELELSR